MTQFNLENLPSLGAFVLVNEIDNTAVNPTVILRKIQNAPAKQIDDTPANDIFYTEMPLTIDSDKVTTNLTEEYWLHGGIDNGDGTYTYESIRGIPNCNIDNPPTIGLSRNYREHKEGAFCTIDETWLTRNLKSIFVAASSTFDATYGEPLLENNVFMYAASGGKIIKYNGINPPRGLVLTDGVLDAIETVGSWGYKKTGVTGFVSGMVWVETDGTLTQTPTLTTKPIGDMIADSSGNFTIMQLVKPQNFDIGEATQSQAEAGTTQGVYMSPLRTLESITANQGSSFLTDKFRVKDTTDDTKEIAIDATSIATGTTRTITMPDEDVDLGDVGTPTGKSLVEVYLSSRYTTISTIYTRVYGFTELIDNNSDFSSQFTAPEDGIYRVDYELKVHTGNATGYIAFLLNNTTVVGDEHAIELNTAQERNGHFFIRLTASQTIGLFMKSGNAAVHVSASTKSVNSRSITTSYSWGASPTNAGTRYSVQFVTT